MPQTARSHRNRFAWGIQASEGTAQVTNGSLYEVSMEDGGVDINADEVPFDLSDANDLPVDFYIRRFDWSADATVPLDVDSAGSLYTAHLGTDTPSGAGPYTHVVTKSDSKAFVTLYEQKPGVTGGTDYWIKCVDGFVRGIEVTAAAGEYLRLKTDVIGKTAIFNPTTPPAATRDLRTTTTTPTGSYATMVGSTLKLDLATTPSTTTIRNIENVSINSAYSAELIQTDASTPNYLNLGEFSVGVTAQVVLTAAEFQAITQTFWGTTTITTDMAFAANPATPTAGSAILLFNTIGATASRSIQYDLPAMRWRAMFAKVQPSGDAVRITLTGIGKANAATFKVTAINNRATY